MDNIFCTVLSKHRVYQAIAMFCSMYQVMKDFSMFTLCIDDDTYNLLKKLDWKNIILVHVKEFENEELLLLKKQRKINEYTWTLKPIFIENIMIKHLEANRVTYIDSDLFFWQDPTVIFKNQPQYSVLLSRQDIYLPNFDQSLVKMYQKLLGKYNSGIISFKNDEIGCNCVKWWRKRCIECCVNVPEEGKFGDQGYLDKMPELFSNIGEITTPGVNIGHWNYPKYKLSMRGSEIYIDDAKLICYHFSGFRILGKNEIVQIHELDRKDTPFVCDMYKETLKHILNTMDQVDPDFNGYASVGNLLI